MQHYTPNFKQISQAVHEICDPEIATFSSHFSSLRYFIRTTLSFPRKTFLWIDLYEIWHTYKAFVAIHSLKVEDVYAESKGLMDAHAEINRL